MSKNFNLTKVDKLPDSEVQITGEITLPFLVVCRGEAVKHLGERVSISGFRPGHIPEEVLVKHVGEMKVLEEASEIALAREYSHIIEEAKLSPVGRPDVSITKMAPGVPLEFKIKVSVEPEFDLPDYKSSAKKTALEHKDTEVEVSEKEVEETLAELEKRGINPELKEGEDLKEKVKESLVAQKKVQAQEKKRIAILDKLVQETEIKVPKALVDTELAKMLAQFQADVERMGMDWAEYLVQTKKTEEDILKEWQTPATARVKAELIISKIAMEENIEPVESELNHEVEHLLSHHPDADPLRARIYIYSQLRNQKVLEFLESQA